MEMENTVNDRKKRMEDGDEDKSFRAVSDA